MKKKVFFWIIMLTVATVALVTIISTQIALKEQEERVRQLEEMREQLVLDNERLSHDLNEDITDAYIVRIMRKLGYYFPGEKNITFTPTTEEEKNGQTDP